MSSKHVVLELGLLVSRMMACENKALCKKRNMRAKLEPGSFGTFIICNSPVTQKKKKKRWPVKTCKKRNMRAKLDALRACHYAPPNSTSKKHPPKHEAHHRDHRSMQHMRINTGLSLPTPTACVAGSLGVRKAPQLLRGG